MDHRARAEAAIRAVNSAVRMLVRDNGDDLAIQAYSDAIGSLYQTAYDAGKDAGYQQRQGEIETNVKRLRDAWREGPMFK